jgi:hypothetical protein
MQSTPADNNHFLFIAATSVRMSLLAPLDSSARLCASRLSAKDGSGQFPGTRLPDAIPEAPPAAREVPSTRGQLCGQVSWGSRDGLLTFMNVR